MNMINKIECKKSRSAPAAALALTLITLSACGQTAFTVVPGTQAIAAPGTYSIPPKVDILLVEGDKGRMFEAWDQVSQQMPKFLASLDKKGWDYHFTTIPLTTYNAIQSVTGSVYDGNSGSDWKAPYPGAMRFNAGTIAQSFFQLPAVYNGYLNKANVSNALNGYEPGFENIQAILSTGLGSSNFLRKDSLFVPLIVSLGNDTSGVNFCVAPDSTADFIRKVPCEQVTTPCNDSGGSSCGSNTDSFKKHKTWFTNFRANTQFYAAVPQQDSNNCLGGRASAGYRYQQMASATGGKSFDICSQPMNQILDSLTGQLQSQKLGFKQKYLFISQDADPASIKVTRYIGGDANQAVVIPQDATNGWTYVGAVTDVYAISYPTPMNLSSGFAIQLNGAAEITGSDTTSIDFKPAGAQNSVSK
jgi:hypothetical protein